MTNKFIVHKNLKYPVQDIAPARNTDGVAVEGLLQVSVQDMHTEQVFVLLLSQDMLDTTGYKLQQQS